MDWIRRYQHTVLFRTLCSEVAVIKDEIILLIMVDLWKLANYRIRIKSLRLVFGKVKRLYIGEKEVTENSYLPNWEFISLDNLKPNWTPVISQSEQLTYYRIANNGTFCKMHNSSRNVTYSKPFQQANGIDMSIHAN